MNKLTYRAVIIVTWPCSAITKLTSDGHMNCHFGAAAGSCTDEHHSQPSSWSVVVS